ncbi:MAG: dihydrofolate reductase family protein [Bacillota bacterium]
MRKLKLQVQMSLDGYIAGLNGEMDWITWNWDDELNNYVRKITEPVDLILLGRKLAEGFIDAWASRAANPEEAYEDIEGIRKMNETPKIIFSRTLDKSRWPNAALAKGDLAEEVKKLKQQPGSDIIAYGGAEFVSNLIKYNLIDEYYFFINPAALGKGMSIFNNIGSRLNLKLAETNTFSCGIAVLKYNALSDFNSPGLKSKDRNLS